MHLVAFIIRIYHDARSFEFRIPQMWSKYEMLKCGSNHLHCFIRTLNVVTEQQEAVTGDSE